ncbi:MAG: hypothetical protein ACLFUF_05460, partial [Opitutales bacterium]
MTDLDRIVPELNGLPRRKTLIPGPALWQLVGYLRLERRLPSASSTPSTTSAGSGQAGSGQASSGQANASGRDALTPKARRTPHRALLRSKGVPPLSVGYERRTRYPASKRIPSTTSA